MRRFTGSSTRRFVASLQFLRRLSVSYQFTRMFSKTIAMSLLLACACDAVTAKAGVVNKQMMRREGAMDTNTKLGFQAQKQRLVLDSKGGESDGAHAAHVVKASSGDKRNTIFDRNSLTEFQRGNEAVCYESLPMPHALVMVTNVI